MATNRRERAKPVSRFCFMAPMLLLLSSAYPCPSLDIHPQDKSSLLLFRSWLHDTSRSLSPCLPSNPNCSSWTGLTLNNVSPSSYGVDFSSPSTAALDCSGERLESSRKTGEGPGIWNVRSSWCSSLLCSSCSAGLLVAGQKELLLAFM
ncbi:hypothetical protein K1719_023756 [Acacia pycnantha]|nr:hypothetical protein K1719_023756 [Acacia pycnantha]